MADSLDLPRPDFARNMKLIGIPTLVDVATDCS